MAWTINYLGSIQKDMKRIAKKEQSRIRSYLETQVAQAANPRAFGKALKGAHTKLWRYRVGNYRIICEINDQAITVLVLRIGHRKDIYRN